MTFKYTLCFLVRDGQALMLNRLRSPNMGLWNGVGGKLEPGEDALTCVLREVEEETGIRLPTARQAGTISWTWNGAPVEGICVFVVQLPSDFAYPTPVSTPDGILEWKPIGWVCHADNYGVVSNIRHFLPPMFAGDEPLGNYHFDYIGGQLVSWHYSTKVEGSRT